MITTAYLAFGPDLPAPVAGTDAREAYWMPVKTALHDETLAFDHTSILRDALERARSKLKYATVATVFCAQPFTLSDLRRVYEVIWGFTLDPSNFRRKITQADGFLECTGQRRIQATGRPHPCIAKARQACSHRLSCAPMTPPEPSSRPN